MLRVYLDQNHWIYLAQALHGRPRTTAEADAALVVRESAAAGLASYPLSFAHLEETWRKRDATKRIRLANTMAAISRNHAIASPRELLPGELDRALAARFGQPTDPRPIRPFGIGIAHISGGAAPKLDPNVVKRLIEQHPALDARRVTDWVDALLLGGPNVDLPYAEFDAPRREIHERFAEDEQAQMDRFAAHGADSDMRRRGVAARLLLDMRDALHEAQRRTTISTDEIYGLGDAGLTDLMRDLPTRDALLALATTQHRNPQTRWQPNDLNDLVFISLAVGYCDIVVTERRWAGMLNASDVPERRGTIVLSKLADLPRALTDRERSAT